MSIPITVLEVPKEDCIFVPEVLPDYGSGYGQVLFPPEKATVVETFHLPPNE